MKEVLKFNDFDKQSKGNKLISDFELSKFDKQDMLLNIPSNAENYQSDHKKVHSEVEKKEENIEWQEMKNNYLDYMQDWINGGKMIFKNEGLNKKDKYTKYLQDLIYYKTISSKGILRDLTGYDDMNDTLMKHVISDSFNKFPDDSVSLFKNELIKLVEYRKQMWLKQNIWIDDSDTQMSRPQQKQLFIDKISGHYTKEELDIKKNKLKERYGNRDSLLLTKDEDTFNKLSEEFYDKDIREFGTIKSRLKKFILQEVPTGNYEKFYLLTEEIINNLSEYGEKDVIDFYINFIITDDFSRSHIQSLAEGMTSLDSHYAVTCLLENIKKQNLGDDRRRVMTEILLHIELGKLHISQDGLEYLDKKFDLGNDNGKFDFAQRLTVDGDLGLFKDEKLGKYLNIKDDILSDEAVIQAQTKEFVYDTLFISSEDETKAERDERENILKQFKESYYHFYDDDFFKQTGVRFNNLSFREQSWYLEYTLNNNDNKDKIYDFSKKYKEDGIKTFLSLNQNNNMGDNILLIGKNFEHQGAALIFKKYNSITKFINNLDDSLKNYFKDSNTYNENEKNKIASDLLRKAQYILIQYAQRVESGEDITYGEVINELGEISEQIILFASVFKLASKKGIELLDMKGIELKKIMAADLSDNDRQEILRIFQNNRTNYPKTLLKNNTEQLQQAVFSGDDRFYTMKINGELISFIRFSDLADGDIYIGSFNVRPEAKSSAIGDALIKTTLEQEGKEKVIEGVVYSKHPQFASYIKYLESLGFKVVGEIDDYEGTGEKFYKIERQPDTHIAIEKSAA